MKEKTTQQKIDEAAKKSGLFEAYGEFLKARSKIAKAMARLLK